MKRFFAAVVVAGLTVPSMALADQCAWITKDQARDAVHFAPKGLKFVDYCEPCGDTMEKVKIGTIESVESKQAADGVSFEVLINGEAKDAAYVFVETVAGTNEYENLASLSSCKTDGVSAKITVQPKPVKGPVKGPKKGAPKKGG